MLIWKGGYRQMLYPGIPSWSLDAVRSQIYLSAGRVPWQTHEGFLSLYP